MYGICFDFPGFIRIWVHKDMGFATEVLEASIWDVCCLDFEAGHLKVKLWDAVVDVVVVVMLVVVIVVIIMKIEIEVITIIIIGVQCIDQY